jgi:hypothetical protein
MEEKDLLLTMAEVAVAFVGFSSLVSILGRRGSTDDPRLDAIRMRGLIESSLLVVAFSLVPSILHHYEVSALARWRLSSALFATAAGALSYLELRRASKLVASLREEGTPYRTWIGIPMLGTVAVGIGLLAVIALGGLHTSAAPIYLTALGLFLFRGGFAFALVLISLLGRSDSAP